MVGMIDRQRRTSIDLSRASSMQNGGGQRRQSAASLRSQQLVGAQALMLASDRVVQLSPAVVVDRNLKAVIR